MQNGEESPFKDSAKIQFWSGESESSATFFYDREFMVDHGNAVVEI